MVAFKNAFIVATLAGYALAAPILVARQGAGVGDGCNAIFTDTDTSTGQVVKQAGAWGAKQLEGAGLRRRQGAGVGQGCDAILTDADTSSGQIVKQGGAYVASQIKGAKIPAGGAPAKRQLDKMGSGGGMVVAALPGGEATGDEIASETGTIDGDGTEGSAMAGESLGEAELNMGNAITETAFGTTDGDAGAPSKRQLDKIGSGASYIVGALPGGQSSAEKIESSTGTIDGNATNGSAMAGEAIGQAELSMGDAITETAFGTTTNGGSGGGSGGAQPAPKGKPAPGPAKKGPGGPKA